MAGCKLAISCGLFLFSKSLLPPDIQVHPAKVLKPSPVHLDRLHNCLLFSAEPSNGSASKNSSVQAFPPFFKKAASVIDCAIDCVMHCCQFHTLPKQKINFNYSLRKPIERSLGLSALLDWCLILLYKWNYGIVRWWNLEAEKEGTMQQDHHHQNAKQNPPNRPPTLRLIRLSVVFFPFLPCLLVVSPAAHVISLKPSTDN